VPTLASWAASPPYDLVFGLVEGVCLAVAVTTLADTARVKR
jgi:hypothetical protein